MNEPAAPPPWTTPPLKAEAVVAGLLHYHDASGAIIKTVELRGVFPVDLTSPQEPANGDQRLE